MKPEESNQNRRMLKLMPKAMCKNKLINMNMQYVRIKCAYQVTCVESSSSFQVSDECTHTTNAQQLSRIQL